MSYAIRVNTLAAVLGDVVASSSPLFVDLARRILNDLCRLRSASSLSSIIDHVEREFRLQPGTLQSPVQNSANRPRPYGRLLFVSDADWQ